MKHLLSRTSNQTAYSLIKYLFYLKISCFFNTLKIRKKPPGDIDPVRLYHPGGNLKFNHKYN